MLTYPFSPAHQAKLEKTIKLEKGTIIFPTETFYALGCNAISSTAVLKIYQLKNRTQKQPLLILINSWEMLQKYIKHLNPAHKDFLAQYWPGPLTAIFESNGKLSEELNLINNRIAFRMTSDPIARDLISCLNLPLVGTSANISGQVPVTTAQDAFQYFNSHVDLYIDGGITPGGLPSTIIDLKPKGGFSIIRKGVIELD
jgi:L-threonylcarbamoyladenylate synthase